MHPIHWALSLQSLFSIVFRRWRERDQSVDDLKRRVVHHLQKTGIEASKNFPYLCRQCVLWMSFESSAVEAEHVSHPSIDSWQAVVQVAPGELSGCQLSSPQKLFACNGPRLLVSDGMRLEEQKKPCLAAPAPCPQCHELAAIPSVRHGARARNACSRRGRQVAIVCLDRSCALLGL